MLVATTSEIIKKLQEYEAQYGVGAVSSISTHCGYNRDNAFTFNIANTSARKAAENGEKYQRMEVDISAVNDDEIFK